MPICVAGFWKVPSTASLHSGVHPGSQRAERRDGGRQEVRPQVRKSPTKKKPARLQRDNFIPKLYSSQG